GYSDDVRVLRGAVNGDFGDGRRSTSLFVQLSGGERDAASGASGLSRADASREFWKVNARAAHYRDLSANTGLYLAADGQWSPDALLASEEFAVGGAPYGRGYNYAELSGDRGVAGTAELRVGWDPKRPPITFVQGYGFVDAAQVWNRGGDSAALASTGLGVRVRVGERVTVGLEAAKPLTRTPYERGDKDWRTFVSISARF
ncbi:ShlB/FhaC/HecB family hemolysin secretion/activation protein, partial [Phenylobacterium sp.]|uniref:ShlB/FhaC/HecB family hemolysin secretion/activation protein n=1 Tax=Phenylobacterium sp. TaxID=1871053 RepID=UPI00286A8DE1